MIAQVWLILKISEIISHDQLLHLGLNIISTTGYTRYVIGFNHSQKKNKNK